MKNKTWILLYLLVLVLIVFFEYQLEDTSSQKSSVSHYEIEKNKELDAYLLSYTKSIENNLSLNTLWKIVPKKIEQKSKIEDNKTQEFVEVTLKEKTLCIKKECFKLLGIFGNKNQTHASFYNKERKKRVEAFLVGEVLDASIKIKSIIKNKVVFSDINSTREWSISLFDINSSKYKPKEFE